jgi:hypothetical protein
VRQEWTPQHQGNIQNLDSLGYVYSVSPSKTALCDRHQQWATHSDVVTQQYPTFGDGWTSLASTTGVGGTTIGKLLSTSDTSAVVVEAIRRSAPPIGRPWLNRADRKPSAMGRGGCQCRSRAMCLRTPPNLSRVTASRHPARRWHDNNNVCRVSTLRSLFA